MVLSEEKTQELLNDIIQQRSDPSFKLEVKSVVYRDDYQDYVIVLSNMCYTEIREKLIKDYIELKHEDVKRELMFKLKHAAELEEWQKEELGISEELSGEDIAKNLKQGPKGEEKIEVDDEEGNDWM